ncbi:hypothetical protein SCP_0201730 [Sparassis crispa]|uniref:Uncharacterized protein n=1 Tax=Sparassis crispa TaxID=139825 RepID=A0A401G9W3_9APHY|nr:hypothetical protein SCP_0201730 [Sparassis crispa]GBE78976.1 hypothetical protein SCP_0201730 [Sparassis crispa]
MASTAIPPLNKISLVGIWIESVLWGMKMLGVTSIVLFAFATAHIAGSLHQLLEAFIYVPSPAPPLYSTLYWANKTNGVAVMKTVLYDTTVWLQDIALVHSNMITCNKHVSRSLRIWRLYVVWDRNWLICILPVVVDLAHMGSACAATGLLAQPNADIYGVELKRLGPVSWSLDLAVNISVTAAIAGRLWYMGRKVSLAASSRGLNSDQNPYLAPIFHFRVPPIPSS